VIINTDKDKSIMLRKLMKLKDRIETFGHKYGFENIDNYTERRRKNGVVGWRVSDWEFVDNMHNTIYNDHDFGYDGDLLKRLNKMWKKYHIKEDEVGTVMIVKKTDLIVKLVEILHFPTRYKCNDGNIYATYEVDIKWGDENE
jgi:hypothetical protein